MSIQLPSRSLVMLSGPSGAGKSTFIKKNHLKSMTVSSDDLRVQVVGSKFGVVEDTLAEIPNYSSDAAIFQLMRSIVEVRLKERLTTVVDATLLDDKSRKSFAEIAEKYEVPCTVLMLNTPLQECLTRNLQRKRVVEASVIESQYQRMQWNSRYPHEVISSDETIQWVRPDLNTTNLYAVGDVHGMLPELKQLIEAMGFVHENGIPKRKDGGKLLFLGDLIDRGPHSLETLEYVKKCVEHGHLCLMGNHEKKMIHMWEQFQSSGEVPEIQGSNLQTFYDMLRLPRSLAQEYIDFMKRLPLHYTIESKKIAFCHGNLDYYHPDLTTAGEMLYGSQRAFKKANDEVNWPIEKLTEYKYFNLWKKKQSKNRNQYKLIHGHVPTYFKNDACFSLEDGQAFGIRMLGLPIDSFIKDGANKDAFQKNLVEVPTSFDFNIIDRKRKMLKRDLKDLEEKKWVKRKDDKHYGLSIYKYSAKAFFKSLWKKSPLLTKTRGLVLDKWGNIVQHPFDKVFNYGEEKTGLSVPSQQKVVAVEKMNGFLACVRLHPYQENGLLVTTTGSFESEFVDLAKEVLNQEGMGKVYKMCYNYPDTTFMFEIISPKDPHIIPYSEEQYGAWLIGARDTSWEAKCYAEKDLDNIAQRFSWKRPAHMETSMHEALELAQKSTGEGYMLREADTGEFICKVKSPWYLYHKFIARMNDEKVDSMFQDPEAFKKKSGQQQVHEEFFPIIDSIVQNNNKEQWKQMGDQERLQWISQWTARQYEVQVDCDMSMSV